MKIAEPFFRWRATAASNAEVEGRIGDDLGRILTAIRGTGRRIDAVLLSGSLGRGEGTVVEWQGVPRLLSDYDLCVFSDDIPDHRFFWGLARDLSTSLWAPQVSIGAVPTAALSTVPPSVWSYDMRHGGRIVLGAPAVQARLPCYRAADIPTWEALKLVFNYAAYLLAATDPVSTPSAISGAERVELRSSIIRMAHRLGDAVTIFEGQYHHLLARRRDVLPTLRSFQALSDRARELILWGCEEKLCPAEFWTFDPDGTIGDLLPLIESLLRGMLQRFLDIRSEDLVVALREYRCRFPAPRSGHFGVRERLAHLFGRDQAGLPRAARCFDPYHYALSAVPLVLLSLPGLFHRPAYLEEARRLFGMDDQPPGVPHARDAWSQARATVVRFWTTYCSRR